MSATARLHLPYIAPLQAQKQYSYNEAMAALDLLVQPAVLSRSLTAPPDDPDEGDAYIVAPSASAGWSGRDGQFACRRDGAWAFRAPDAGWLAFVIDAGELALYQSGSWVSFVTAAGSAVEMLGINTSADTTTRLAVAAAATLLTHDGGSHRVSVNKAASGDTASLLLQDGFSGRAEIGLTGDDNLHVKVSSDGSSWLEALLIERSGGRISLPRGQLAFPGTQNASPDPNTLDDYEEGTWTPGLSFGGGSTGIAYSATPAGRYTKIGRKVFVTGTLTLSSKGSSSGAVAITGLPFTAANDGIPVAASIGLASGFSLMSGAVTGTILPNAAQIGLFQSANGSGAALTQVNTGASASLVFSATYEV